MRFLIIFIALSFIITGCILSNDKNYNPLMGKWQDDGGNVFLIFNKDNTYSISRNWLINGTPAYGGIYKVWGDSLSLQWTLWIAPDSLQTTKKIYKYTIHGDASLDWLELYSIIEGTTMITAFKRFKS